MMDGCGIVICLWGVGLWSDQYVEALIKFENRFITLYSSMYKNKFNHWIALMGPGS